MTDHRCAAPLALALPGGVTAEHVAGSAPPRYTLDGAPTAIDVTIPNDLAAKDWHWNGSFLCWRDDPACQLMISTDLHPPPGWPGTRRDCFTVARAFDLSPHATPPAQSKQGTRAPAQPAPLVQLTLFEDVKP